ncbi:hypothetical protein SCUP515_11612 [Seiridium cupressi]
MEYTGGGLEADHLCVLVHGLWGNPNHMRSVAKALRNEHPADKLYLLVAKRNTGSFTYDGVERGGERVCAEIEEELESIKSKGGKITKLSIVGYSLGGLVARYAVGLLGAKGILDEVEPTNFTTFASPHLGVRTPSRGWHNHVWNVLGARTLSMSGRQLFTIDDFRDTGRPLFAIMADPNSIFMSSLAKFKRRTLYANVVNDRSAVYYTTGIAKTDPYTDLSKIKANYVEGYEEVILDPLNPVSPRVPKKEPASLASVKDTAVTYLKNAPMVAFLVIFIPVGVVGFLLSSVVENFRSSKRIKLHESGAAGIQVENYRVPIMIQGIRGAVEDVYENVNSSQHQEYLAPSDSEGEDAELNERERQTLKLERKQSHPHWPTLALAPYQFDMVNGLNELGWRKYPVDTTKVFSTMATPVSPPRRITRGSLARFAYNDSSSMKENSTPSITDIEDAVASNTTASTTTRKRKRIAQSSPATVKTEILEEKTAKGKPATTARRARKPARKTIDPTTNAETVSAPSDWEEMYNLVKAMRLDGGPAANAAVDTMGCERLALPTASPRDQRLHTLIALMLSSQTKDTTNAVAMRRLQTELPPHQPGAPAGLNLDNLLAVESEKLNELIWVVGFHNNKTKYIKQTAEILRDKWEGDIPDTIEGLTSLPGVGPKMGYLCLSAAWDKTEGIGVDVHVHRITNIWGWNNTKNPEETRMSLQSWLPKDKWREVNWLLVGFGQTVCLPVGRRCGDCELGLRGLCKAAERGKVLKGRRERETKIEVDEVGRVLKEEVVEKEELLLTDEVKNEDVDEAVRIKEEDTVTDGIPAAGKRTRKR